jgi:flagellar basal-body rod modification protein FlgD
MITGATTSAGASANQAPTRNRMSELKAEDFIKMMITQLQNQDPMEPAKNSELLAQMSQIGSLQSSTQLQDSLKGIVLQNQIGGAGNLLGKTVQGMDAKNETIKGVVNSIRVEKDKVMLELDSGKTLAMDRVTHIGPPPGDVTTKTPVTKAA